MALTNPTSLVSLEDLAYFKQKIAEEFPSATVATVAESEAAANELT